MPVFFYIDPEFLDDPALYKVDTITLSYTFFQAKEAHDLGIQWRVAETNKISLPKKYFLPNENFCEIMHEKFHPIPKRIHFSN